MAFWLDAAKDTYFAKVWEPRGGRSTLVVNQLPQGKLPNFTIQHQARPKCQLLLFYVPNSIPMKWLVMMYPHILISEIPKPKNDGWITHDVRLLCIRSSWLVNQPATFRVLNTKLSIHITRFGWKKTYGTPKSGWSCFFPKITYYFRNVPGGIHGNSWVDHRYGC